MVNQDPALSAAAKNAIAEYLGQVRWAGAKGIDKRLGRLGYSYDTKTIEAHMKDAGCYATFDGLWCQPGQLEALQRHRMACAKEPMPKKKPALQKGVNNVSVKRAGIRRPTLRLTQVCGGRSPGGKCSKCGAAAEYQFPNTTWGLVKLCTRCKNQVMARPIGTNLVSIHIISTGMGTGRRS
ncbi:MAG: hypothetical protein WBI63_01940 [Coriobacteriia bacterium]